MARTNMCVLIWSKQSNLTLSQDLGLGYMQAGSPVLVRQRWLARTTEEIFVRKESNLWRRFFLEVLIFNSPSCHHVMSSWSMNTPRVPILEVLDMYTRNYFCLHSLLAVLDYREHCKSPVEISAPPADTRHVDGLEYIG